MAHIVFIINDLVSLRNAVIDLTRELTDAGHQVTVASYKQQDSAFEAYDIPYVPLPVPTTLSENRSLIEKFRYMRQRRDAAVDALRMDETLNIVRKLSPDLLVIEAELADHVIALSQLEIPVATLAYFPAIFKRRGVPPLHEYIVPREGWRGSDLGIEVAWWRYQLRLIRGEIRHFLTNGGLYRRAVVRHLAKRVGFNYQRDASMFHWLNPIAFPTLPMLYANPLEFDFPHTSPDNVRYLGNLLNLERIDAGSHDADKARLAQVIDAAQASNKRIIYCAFGSLFKGDDSAFIRRVMDAVAEKPTWEMIISMGKRRNDAFSDLPNNVHLFQWVDQLEVLAAADVMVTHAGNGTVMECITFGVPMLSYPFDTNDQFGIAARITYHNIGVVGNRESDSTNDIRSHIETVLQDDAIRANIQQMRQSFTQYTADYRLQIFEDLLNH